MSTNLTCSVFIGNLDERVSDRVLYDILIQAGRVVDLYIPRDKETDRPKGYAFAKYETEEIANYAVMLFTGLVTIYSRTLRFAISGEDKPAPSTLSSHGVRHAADENMEKSHSMKSSHPSRLSDYPVNYPRVPLALPGVLYQKRGYRSDFNGKSYGYTQRIFREGLDDITRTRPSHYDTRSQITYPSY